MPQKQFSIYKGDSANSSHADKQLYVEAGNQHIACVVNDVNSNLIEAL